MLDHKDDLSSAPSESVEIIESSCFWAH